MMQGLMHMEGGEQVLPFVRLFYSSPSAFLWEDSMGEIRHIPQGEGGEEGEPLMPLMYAMSQHSAYGRSFGEVERRRNLVCVS